MKDLKKLPFHKQQVRNLLIKLKLNPLKSINNILKDRTRSSYSSVVKNQKGAKFFIKIRLSDTKQQKEFFFQSYWLGYTLNKHKPSLYHLTPKLLDGQIKNNIDYLLYQYIKGKNMGSRRYHDVFKFKKEDLVNIVKIHQAIKEIPNQWFPKTFRKRKAEFYQFLILEDIPFNEKSLAQVYSQQEINQIHALSQNKRILDLLSKNTNTLQHGDLQAPNFLKTKKGRLLILDFDQSSLTNRFYDAAYFYNHAFRKPRLRDALLKAFVGLKRLNNEEGLLFYFIRFCTAFVWVKQFLEKTKIYQQQKMRDFSIREKAFYLRIEDTKSLLNRIGILT